MAEAVSGAQAIKLSIFTIKPDIDSIPSRKRPRSTTLGDWIATQLGLVAEVTAVTLHSRTGPNISPIAVETRLNQMITPSHLSLVTLPHSAGQAIR